MGQHKKELKIREIEIEGKILEDSERKQNSEISEQERDLYETIGNGISNQVQRELNVLSHHFDLSRGMLKLNESLKSQSFFGSDDQNEGNEDPLESDGFVRVTPPLSPVSRHSLLRSISGSMMSLTSLVDEGLNKAIKKQTNSNQII